jgi:hypothetical protein
VTSSAEFESTRKEAVMEYLKPLSRQFLGENQGNQNIPGSIYQIPSGIEQGLLPYVSYVVFDESGSIYGDMP